MDTARAISVVKSKKKIITWMIAAFFLFTITGFFIVPPVLKSVLIKKLSENLHREVSIGKIQFNPYVLTLRMTGFNIKERGGADTFVSFEELFINIQSVSLIKRGLVIQEARLKAPYANIIFNEDRSYNFSDLLVKDAKVPETKKEPFRFSVNNISIAGGSIDFADNTKKKHHKVRDIGINIPFISNLPYYVETFIQPSFEAKFNDTPVSLTGTSKPFADSLETKVEVRLKDFDIPYYLAYVPVELKFSLPSAKMDAGLEVFFTQYKNRQQTLGVRGPITFRDIRSEGRDGSPLVSLPLLDISVDTPDVMTNKFHLAQVLIEAPEIHAVRLKDGSLNLQAFVPDTKKKTSGTKTASEERPFQLSADNIRVKEGRVFFDDLLPEKKFSTQLDHINIEAAGFSTAKDHSTPIEASLQTESAESVKLTSGVVLDPLSSEGKAEMAGIVLSKYSPYYAKQVLFDIREGTLDVSTGYSFKQALPEPLVLLSELAVHLNSLKLRKRDETEDFLHITSLAIEGTGVNIPDKEITIGKFTTQKGIIALKRLQDGSINLAKLVPDTTAAGQADGPAPTKETGRPWNITVTDLLTENYTVRFEDLAASQPVSLTADRIRLKGSNISTIKNTRGRMSLAMNFPGKGSVTAGGAVGFDPLKTQLKINVKDFAIKPLQAYFTDMVRILVTDGVVLADGDLLLNGSKEKKIAVKYKGSVSLARFASVDKENVEDFLKWNSLYFGGMDISSEPLSVNIDEIALSDFYSRLIVYPDGTLNVQNIFAGKETADEKLQEQPPAEQTPPAQEEKSTKVVKIGKVTLQAGTINFTDKHIEPNYSANLLEVGGRVSGLSSEEDRFAEVDLRGMLDNYAPLEITGKINPLLKDLYVDLKVDFKNIDLSPVTPYSGRYVGYTIEKGKLTLSMTYLIANRKLEAGNRIFLDQFTLGNSVESPDATKLPVKLAIALLKNRSGEIDLDLPVTGDLDDPNFHIGRVIIKILLNLLVKAATAPFALLGALFGGGEELSFLEFDYGLTAINEEGIKKLDTLTKALYDRPSLKLELTGYADTERDRDGLRQHLFERKIKAQKLKEMIKKGEQAVTVDDIRIEKEEYDKYLKMAYKEDKFPKPRNIIGMLKDLPAAEMEKLMLTHIEIKDDDLRALAAQRAAQVRDYILRSKQVEPERIFLVEPRTLQPEKKEKQKESRVEFAIK